MIDFLHGAITLSSLAIGLFFLRYWRASRDRLFIFFSAAFWLLALHWLVLSIAPAWASYAHVPRFLAFVLIAVAVIDKNRKGKTPRL